MASLIDMMKILVVEDDFMIADCLEEILQDAGYDVCGIASQVEQAIRIGEEQRPDLAVIDLRLADGRLGTEVGAALSARGTIGILYVSGNPDHPALAQVPADGCIAKPYSPDEVLAALTAIRRRMQAAPIVAQPSP
jgi:DNA-binding response OmpR family regulator